MICLHTNRPVFLQDMADIIRLFFFGQEVIQGLGDTPDKDRLTFCHDWHEQDDTWVQQVSLWQEGRLVVQDQFVYPAMQGDEVTVVRFVRRAIKLCVYRMLQKHTHHTPPWGALTGIRPTKLLRQMLGEKGGMDEAVAFLCKEMDVQPAKTSLLRKILEVQEPWYAKEPDALDVYVGIPFCPSRCAYCSFFGMDTQQGKNLIDPYIDALVKELQGCAGIVEGRVVRSLYVGGGTPTALGVDGLAKVLEATASLFPGVFEKTVEAGRPDTLGDAMIAMMKNMGVTRVSVNPQTMNDETLVRVGRRHTVQQTVDALFGVRAAGFQSVNMDIILGLPGEGCADMERTLSKVSQLPIDNLTVHTLAIKRSSKIHEFPDRYPLPGADAVEGMVNKAGEVARSMGMQPYYMYRQKYMTGNLENVGYATPGMECVYNIDMMEETHSILAFGAGAICKRMRRDEECHERLTNHKSIAHYIANVDAAVANKVAFFK